MRGREDYDATDGSDLGTSESQSSGRPVSSAQNTRALRRQLKREREREKIHVFFMLKHMCVGISVFLFLFSLSLPSCYPLALPVL